MKNKLKKYAYPFLAFFIPVLVMIILFIVKGGLDVEQLSIGDMQAQHVDMLLYFKRILTGKEGIFYSIINGMGGNTYSSMAYYMLSPINLLVLFFKDADILQAIRLMILIKIGLSGLTMYLLLNSKYSNKKNYSLLFSMCYALMSFVINNYFCTLWLDAVYLAPLVLLGIDKLINEKKVLLYIITLALSIFTNFYMGYMICIFSVLYFIYSMVIKYTKKDKKEIIKCSIRFLIASLLAGLSMAIIYVPTILSVMKSDRMVITANETSLDKFIYRIFLGSYQLPDFLSYFHPCLYCGLIVLPLLVSLIYNKKIKEKEKVVTFSIILLFIFSILFHQLSYIWHGFSYPIGYNFRFSYLFSLFVLLVSHKQLCTRGNTKPTKVMKYSLAVLFILCIIGVFKCHAQLNGYISLALLLAYILVLLSNKKKMQYVLLVLTVLELGYNSYTSFYVNNDHYTTRKTLQNDICNNIPDSNGYRVSGYEYYGTNENVACSFSGTRLFATTINSRISNLYTKVGFNGGINMYNDNLKNTPIVYSLIGVKYFYNNTTMDEYKLLKEFQVNKDNKYHNDSFEETNFIYENEYALKMGYMVQGYLEAEENPFDYQNSMIKQFSGIDDDVLVRITNENSDSIIDSKYIYLMIYSDVYSITINGNEYVEVPAGTVISFENTYNTKDINIRGINRDGSEAVFDAYYLDLSKFMTAINTLKNNQIDDITIDKNKIKTSITAKTSGVLALSIPYDEGFKIYVDGEEANAFAMYNMFTGINLSEGYHDIEMIYTPQGFSLGLSITTISIIAFIPFIMYIKKSKKGDSNE